MAWCSVPAPLPDELETVKVAAQVFDVINISSHCHRRVSSARPHDLRCLCNLHDDCHPVPAVQLTYPEPGFVDAWLGGWRAPTDSLFAIGYSQWGDGEVVTPGTCACRSGRPAGGAGYA